MASTGLVIKDLAIEYHTARTGIFRALNDINLTFESAMLGQLVVNGLALTTPHQTQAGRRQMIVVWISITTAGRKAIA